MSRALAIGVLTAVVLTCVRGSIADAPWVLLVFGSAGFLGYLLISRLIRRDSSTLVPHTSDRVPRWSLIRNLAAVFVAASLLYWSGPVSISAGFSGWIVALNFCIAAPLAVCLLATRWPIILGLFTATCITVSIVVENARLRGVHGDAISWMQFPKRDFVIWALIWAIAVGLSLLVSVPIQTRRRSIVR